MSYYSKFMVKYSDMSEAVVEINLSSDQIARISKIMMEDVECRSPYCECEKGKCSSGKIDKRGESTKAKDKRQFIVMPRLMSIGTIARIAKEIDPDSDGMLTNHIYDAYSLMTQRYSVPATPYESSTVPYAESTLRTRAKWIELCKSIQQVRGLAPELVKRACTIQKEIERSIEYGRPFNAGTDEIYKPKAVDKSTSYCQKSSGQSMLEFSDTFDKFLEK